MIHVLLALLSTMPTVAARSLSFVLAAGVGASTALFPVAEPALAVADCSVSRPQITILGAASGDREAACAGAERAITFLAAQGFAVDTPLTITVVDRVDSIAGSPLLGAFDPRTGMITISAWRALTASDRAGTMFEIPLERELYTSIFTHEVAHAILHANAGGQRLSHAAHEYVAYTVQLATMAPALRERILAAFPGGGFTADTEINDMILAFDPNRFGAFAYRHLTASDDPAAVLHGMLKRRARASWVNG